ncbi:cation-translocating P-type ATPase [Dawidia soli]|uniref:Cation-translocating P-type ATPase n=1 Tax=Dawidia soli TaxID=2782352 RepID=A0AAP2GGT7_9BACT|nr:cation-translocating P-type ATPase [Dawidia soli]MBT1686466.1 cation-translocating P-type ATPase [Dawidia soli]
MHTIEGITGLTADQVNQARERYGRNTFERKKHVPFLKRALQEPMLMLLVLASAIYFLREAYAEGAFMLAAIAAVSFISFYQESRSKAALDALQEYTRPQASVIRNATVMRVPAEELVVGDHFIVEEGELVPADGVIERSNDLSVNEAILTGESMSVQKTAEDKFLYQGTLVNAGLAVCKATAVGMHTQMGRIGKGLQDIEEPPSPLQIQLKGFVRNMAMVGLAAFLAVWGIYFFKTSLLMQSLLKALTLAMSILPEEIPVAFSTFMALGAWRLAQVGVIVKNIHTVETLGSATVICVDKTGTLTKNEMALVGIYDMHARITYGPEDFARATSIIATAMWASEPLPFDPMELAIHRAYAATHPVDARAGATLIHEYPLGGTPPIMTHVFEDQKGNRIIAAKGAPEAFLHAHLPASDLHAANDAFHALASKGFRVLAVAEAVPAGPDLPADQHEFRFLLKGLVAFYDPPKENIPGVLESFYDAGIQVKLLTGDNLVTAGTIARQINFRGTATSLTGEQVMSLADPALQDAVEKVSVFSRMFPDAKLKVIEALRKHHHVVAMTGDGVNDAPALKAAHIGIAMGRKGSEVARQASALILSNDDLSAMVAAVTIGRKIYNNLKKAIRYIISIHIPIVLIVLLPLMLGWPYPEILTPVHVIFLELIMGPTCSIVYEHEPIEQNVMTEKPRSFTKTFFRISELAISIVQGLAITAGLILIYWYSVNHAGSQACVTAMVFVTLVTANLLLTLVNRSFYYSIFVTLMYKNRLIPLTLAATGGLCSILFTIPALRRFFHFELLTGYQFGLCVATGVLSIMWIEVYKALKRHRTAKSLRR